MSRRRALSRLALAIASMVLTDAAGAQDSPPALASHFQQVCGTTAEAGPSLPGDDIVAADAPGFFVGDLRRATQSRVVKVGERYAMRALVPSSADPQHAVFLKCAVASGSTSFSETVETLSAMLSAKPSLDKTAQGMDYARFSVGMTAYSVFSEPEGWVSVFKMDMLMTNIPRKYLKKGTKPAPMPSVQ